MKSTTSFIRAAGALVFMGWSSLCLAGGHGGGALVFHGGVHGAGRPSVSGGWRGWGGSHALRNSVPRFAHSGYARPAAVYGARFGHANTAYFGHAGQFGTGAFARGQAYAGRPAWRGTGYGRRGLARYAFGPRGFGRNRRILPGFIGPGVYPYGDAFGDGYGPGFDGGAGYSWGSGGGYAEPPLAATYAEPPLGPSPYGGYDGLSFEGPDAGYGRAAGFGGGPHIISVRAGDRLQPRPCSCRHESDQGPVVYRFGVGSYY